MPYLWQHEPFLSSPPAKMFLYILKPSMKDEIDEMAVFELENGKFLFIRFYGTKEDLSLGFTDIEEFDILDQAVNLYNQFL